MSEDSNRTGLQAVEHVLWTRFGVESTASAREAVFVHYLPYGRAIAAQLYAGRHRDDVEFKDFLQLACIGLLESIDRFEPERGIPFQTFCTPRLKGAVLSGITRLTDGQEQVSLQRRVRRERLTSLDDDQSCDTFQTLATIAVGLAIGFLLDDTGLFEETTAKPTPYGNAYQTIALRQTKERLHGAVEQLPERNQRIIRYHYFHGLGFEQIGNILGITKGRVSQLHRAALLELRTRIGDTQHLFTVS
ncbi:sigma-70 family RNA polymerase sigma factor [Paraburkholderia sp. GAS82]|uniref:sigma-70 family RNA polymerase sigma factor n=1 Tax=Paraburkholderia sp. GAS82 TaxID=3035137 RepID=UPI003D1998B5